MKLIAMQFAEHLRVKVSLNIVSLIKSVLPRLPYQLRLQLQLMPENERQYWSGKVSWCNVDRVDNFGRYSLTLYPDTKAYNEIMKLKQEGLQNVIKKDDD